MCKESSFNWFGKDDKLIKVVILGLIGALLSFMGIIIIDYIFASRTLKYGKVVSFAIEDINTSIYTVVPNKINISPIPINSITHAFFIFVENGKRIVKVEVPEESFSVILMGQRLFYYEKRGCISKEILEDYIKQ